MDYYKNFTFSTYTDEQELIELLKQNETVIETYDYILGNGGYVKTSVYNRVSLRVKRLKQTIDVKKNLWKVEQIRDILRSNPIDIDYIYLDVRISKKGNIYFILSNLAQPECNDRMASYKDMLRLGMPNSAIDEIKNIKNKKSKNGDNSQSYRFKILKRDNYRCQICGRTAKEDGVKLEVDHKVPRAKGGKNTMKNLWTLCFDCNSGKSDKDL